MGIFGLESHILNDHPATCPRVSIAVLAQKYKTETGRDTAVAVVDAGNRIHSEVGLQEQLYGGQYKQLSERMVEFARQLEGAGVTPVFYFNGAPSEGRLNVWQERKQSHLERVQKAFDRIATWGLEPQDSVEEKLEQRRAHHDQQRFDGRGRGRAYSQGQPSYPSRGVWTNRRDHHNQPRGTAAFRRGVRRGSVLHTRDAMMPSCGFDCVKLALKAAGFKVLVSVGELDAEIGRYCRSHGCFAVLSRDTDFVAMEAARYYLSVSHLDENMTTLLYDRDAITEAFGLSDKRQLPLLMALLANSCVPAPYLVPLHVKAMRRPLDSLDPAQKFWPSDLIAPLAQLVRNELWNLSAAEAVATILNRALAKYQPRQLNDFCKQLGFEDSTAFREALRLQLEASLVSHDYMPPVGERLPAPQAAPRPALTPSAERVLIVARQRQVALEFATPVVLALLEKRVWQESCTLEDPALPPGCCSAAALRHLRRRLYGVLLHHQAAPGSVREFIVACSAPASLKLQPADVTPIPLDVRSVPHPGLLSLWRGESGADAQWRLLAWCLCPSQSGYALLQHLRALPPRLVIPAAAMYLLRHTGALAASIRAAAPASSVVRGPHMDNFLMGSPSGHPPSPGWG